MALIDEVQNRYSEALLIRLSNPDAPEVTSLDVTATGRLALACDDVEADFATEAGLNYDNDKPRMVSIAVDGVIAKLSMRGSQSRDSAQADHEDYIARVRALKGRVLAETTGVRTPSEQSSSDTPWSDDGNFKGVEPERD